MGRIATVRATINRSITNAGLGIHLYDGTGKWIKGCYTDDFCSHSFLATWVENLNPRARNFTAKVVANDDAVQQETALFIPVHRFYFGVSITFGDPQASGAGVTRLVTVTTNQSVTGTGYVIRIRKPDGTIVATCTEGTVCRATVPADGIYYGSVEEAGTGAENASTPSYASTPDGGVDKVDDDDVPSPPQPLCEPGSAGCQEGEPDEDKLDLARLAARFGSPQAICTALVSVPYRTPQEEPPSTLSKEQFTCEAQAATGASRLTVLRAVVTASAIGMGIAYLLREYLDEGTEEAPEPTTTPTPTPTASPTPAPTPVPPLPPVGRSLADELMDLNDDLEQYDADVIADRCVYRLARIGRIDRGACTSKPIFVTGSDVPEATEHDIEALSKPEFARYVELHYRPGAGRSRWADCGPKLATQQCDEYPFFATWENGPNAYPPTHLKLIDANDNQAQGRHYQNRFLHPCAIASGDDFWMIPVAPRYAVPTMGLCNF